MLSQQHMEMEQHLHQHCPADVTCPSYYGSGGAMVRCALYCETVQMYCIIHGPLLWGLKSNGKCTLCTLHKYMVSHNYVQFGKKKHFSYNSSALLSWVRKFKEVQLSVSSIHCPLSSTVQHPIKYDSLAEHGAVQRSMRFIAQPYFLLCYFVQFCTVFAVLCSFCSFVQ